MSNHNNNNQNNNNKNLLEKTSKFDNKSIKMYASLALYAVLGLALGYALAKGGLYLYNKSKLANAEMKSMTSEMKTDTVKYTGSVTNIFEGENKAEISFDHDESLTVAQGEGNKAKYFYINNASGTKVATVYMSYEGGRGYAPADYVNEVLVKVIPGLVKEDAMLYGSSTWTKVSSTNSVWHLKSSDDKQWLALVENTKANSKAVESLINTFSIK